MYSLLIVFAVCLAAILYTKSKIETGRTEIEEGGGGVPEIGLDDTFGFLEMPKNSLSEILGAALCELKSKGGRGLEIVQLECCVRLALAGRLPAGVAPHLLEKMGAGTWAEKARGAGA